MATTGTAPVGCDVVRGAHLGPRRLGLAGLLQRAAQDQLVLGVHQRARAGGDPVAGVLQGAQVLGRHVLVVEGDDGGAVGDPLQGGEVAVVADVHVGRDQRRRLVRSCRQHPQRLAESDRRLVRHPGELATSDHGDDRHGTGGLRRRPHEPILAPRPTGPCGLPRPSTCSRG